MKKRILSCFMALALCLTLLPATAQAEDGHASHPICGKTCSHTGQGETPHPNEAFQDAKWLTSNNGMLGVRTSPTSSSSTLLTEKDNYVILEPGYYYLSTTADGCDHSYVKSYKPIKIQGDVTICLNGNQIQKAGSTTGPVFEVPSDCTLTLTDCKVTGQIVCNDSSNGSGVYVNGGTLNLYSGQITQSYGQKGTDSNKYGGGVYVGAGGTFNMYGGVITGNSANYGGGVYVKSGTFNMDGGTIKSNTSSGGYGTLSFGGAGVYVEASGNFIMNNTASVTENKIGYGSTGGAGVYVNGGTFEMHNSASVTGNKATNGTLNGGGVYVNGSGTFAMNNSASVSGNTANQGGGVYVESGTFNMNDGTITGNKAKNDKASNDTNGGGVFVNKSGTFNMNDGAISDNKATNSDEKNTTYGGGVYVSGGTFTMNGGTSSVSKNTAKNGGGVSVSFGTFNMNDGKISGNTGNGVFVHNNATFTVSNTPTVTGNTITKNGAASNVYLMGSAYITIGKDGLTGDEGSIGVTKGSDDPIAENVSTDYSGKFFSDNTQYKVEYDKTKEQLVLKRTVVLPDPKYTPPTAKRDLFYTGEPQVLINEGSVEGGQMQYRLGQTGSYSPNIPTELNAGTYTVYFMVKGDAGHNNVLGQQPIMVTIAKAQLSGTPTITKVTKAGTTLSAVVFKEPDGWPKGTVKWADKDGNELNKNTVVEAGIEYRWIFTPDPTDDAAKNYENTGGGVVLYENSGTVTPPSGGGSTGGNTGGTTGGTTGGNTGGSSGGSSSGGSSSSDRDSYDSNPIIKTETKNNPDGSTTKTETRKDGSVTQTTTGKDGGVSKTETKKDGSSVTENKAADGSTGTVKTDKNGQTEASAKVSAKAVEDAKKNGEPVKAPVEVEASRNSNTAPTVKVELPKGTGETKVEIPVSNVKPGTVAVLVHPDGTEEILKDSIPTEDGIQLTVDGGATVKIVDNSKNFIDTRDHWAREEIDFVSARELVNGVSDTIYAPNASATRAQLWTILARQNDADLSGGANWYERAQLWSKDKGISDGTEPNTAINRAQMVTMLYRAAGSPEVEGASAFTDISADSYYAKAAAWAAKNGITAGVGNGRFEPNGTCTRGQIATFLYRYMK